MLYTAYFMTPVPGTGPSLRFMEAHTDSCMDDVSCCRMRNSRIKVDDDVRVNRRSAVAAPEIRREPRNLAHSFVIAHNMR